MRSVAEHMWQRSAGAYGSTPEGDVAAEEIKRTIYDLFENLPSGVLRMRLLNWVNDAWGFQKLSNGDIPPDPEDRVSVLLSTHFYKYEHVVEGQDPTPEKDRYFHPVIYDWRFLDPWPPRDTDTMVHWKLRQVDEENPNVLGPVRRADIEGDGERLEELDPGVVESRISRFLDGHPDRSPAST